MNFTSNVCNQNRISRVTSVLVPLPFMRNLRAPNWKAKHRHGKVTKRVEFNLYLQDTARYEIPHRNKKPIERRFVQYVQFGTVQV